MCRRGWYSSPSRWQTFGSKSAVNLSKGWLHHCSWIQRCHRLSKNNDRVIIKFTRRKDYKQVLPVKKDLKDLTADDLELPRGTKIFANQNLCPYYHILWSKRKRLQRMGKINSFFISGGTVKVKIDESSKPLPIKHLDDLATHFLGVGLSPPTKASLWRTNGCVDYYIIFLSFLV